MKTVYHIENSLCCLVFESEYDAEITAQAMQDIDNKEHAVIEIPVMPSNKKSYDLYTYMPVFTFAEPELLFESDKDAIRYWELTNKNTEATEPKIMRMCYVPKTYACGYKALSEVVCNG